MKYDRFKVGKKRMMKNVSEEVNGEERTSTLSFWLAVFLAFHLSFDLFSKPRGNINCGGFRYATPQYTHQHAHTQSFQRGNPIGRNQRHIAQPVFVDQH